MTHFLGIRGGHRVGQIPFASQGGAQRKFLPPGFNPRDGVQVAACLRQLSAAPQSGQEARRWFGLFSELSLSVSEAQVRLELALHLDRENADLTADCARFEDDVLEAVLGARQSILGIYLASPWKGAMHGDDGGRLVADFFARMPFAGKKIAALQVEEARLVREYREWTGGATTEFGGRTVLVPGLIGRLGDGSSEVRFQAFQAYWGFVEGAEARFQDLFDRILACRCAQAQAAGSSYSALAFAELGRIDYGPRECQRFRASIAQEVVPQHLRLLEAGGRSKVLPWDVGMWPGCMPKSPPGGGTLGGLLGGGGRIVRKIRGDFGDLWDSMEARGLLDVAPRASKQPGAFSVTLGESGIPFVFGNFSGSARDAMTLLHEFGHALHGVLSFPVPNTFLRQPGLEFCEVASLGMELFAFDHLGEYWPDPRDAARAQVQQLYGLLQFWPFMAVVDAWQWELYASPGLSWKERNQLWTHLSREFRPEIDWSQWPQWEGLGWLSRPHIFTAPFYYIDYGFAQLCALQLWARRGPAAVDAYHRALSLGGTVSLGELFGACGTRLDYGPQVVGELARELGAGILRLLRAWGH